MGTRSASSLKMIAQPDQSLCRSLEYSMSVNLLTKHHLEFLILKGGCTGSSESTLFKMPHCWKSHVAAQIILQQCLLSFQSTCPYFIGGQLENAIWSLWLTEIIMANILLWVENPKKYYSYCDFLLAFITKLLDTNFLAKQHQNKSVYYNFTLIRQLAPSGV